MMVVLSSADLEFFDQFEDAPLAIALKTALEGYIDYYRSRAIVDGCFPHDAVAFATIAYEPLFTFEETTLAVTLEGERAGEIRQTPHGARVRLARSVDVEGFRAALFDDLARVMARSARTRP